ncbi:hypothetical protein [Candidatus Skiveiella danica]|jgi:hypothetical protein|uniref:hypothetical protein n=1 Tax=Candidatus Skiveiella danica TaxID=3386177 RepID=UPI002BFFE198|nr:hypothetical protein [Burkholderiaceae bacterium]HWS04904.1 hypothetical protein [Burkholderiaceae bacterium]
MLRLICDSHATYRVCQRPCWRDIPVGLWLVSQVLWEALWGCGIVQFILAHGLTPENWKARPQSAFLLRRKMAAIRQPRYANIEGAASMSSFMQPALVPMTGSRQGLFMERGVVVALYLLGP